jgi:hypothetical protein
LRTGLRWFSILIALSILSYIRESTFISLNAYAKGEHFNYANTYLPKSFVRWALSDFQQNKVILTLLFSLAFISLTIWGIKYGLQKKIFTKIAIGIYSMFVLLAAAFIISGLIMGDWKTFYPFLRILIGYLHNPLIYLFLSVTSFSLLAIKKPDEKT